MFQSPLLKWNYNSAFYTATNITFVELKKVNLSATTFHLLRLSWKYRFQRGIFSRIVLEMKYRLVQQRQEQDFLCLF